VWFLGAVIIAGSSAVLFEGASASNLSDDTGCASFAQHARAGTQRENASEGVAMGDSQRVTIAGHDVECRTLDDQRDEVVIDGKVHKVLRSDDGYNLYDDAFVEPKPTLLEAARAYVEKLAKTE
jgi:hypothetical protein